MKLILFGKKGDNVLGNDEDGIIGISGVQSGVTVERRIDLRVASGVDIVKKVVFELLVMKL